MFTGVMARVRCGTVQVREGGEGAFEGQAALETAPRMGA